MARLMNPNPFNRAARPWRDGRLLAIIAATWILVTGAGCEEISARRSVQEANREFEKGRFSNAAELYEEALGKAPHLDTAHYNAGLTYKKMFRPGVNTPENKQLGETAIAHFAKYLEKFPEDNKIVDIMTSLWVELGDYQSAIGYWERELAKNPKSMEIMSILAGISRQAGDWDKAVEWYRRQVDADPDPRTKAGAYKDIGKLIASRLRGKTHTILGQERLSIADTGIEALQRAAELTPDDAEIQTSLGFLYGQRALAQNSTWAQMIEVASARHHYKQWSALVKKEQEATQGSEGSEPGTPSGGEQKASEDGKGQEASQGQDEGSEGGPETDKEAPEAGGEEASKPEGTVQRSSAAPSSGAQSPRPQGNPPQGAAKDTTESKASQTQQATVPAAEQDAPAATASGQDAPAAAASEQGTPAVHSPGSTGDTQGAAVGDTQGAATPGQ